jgi:hypothetical protein
LAKKTIEEVKRIFEEAGCILLANEYVNNRTSMRYVCNCGDISEITLGSFSKGSRCKNCGIKKRSASQSLGYEHVRKIFEEHNCTLLSTEYTNNRTLLDYICVCGNTSKIRFDEFNRGARCKSCGYERSASARSYDYAYVKQTFEDSGCILLESAYLNNMTPLKYICSCGRSTKARFIEFQRGSRCKQCGIEKVKSKLRFDFEYVSKVFEENGCKLLETQYINTATPMKYMCECGNISTIRFNNLQQGNRCEKCGIEKISGENNYNYNPNIPLEERVTKRNYTAYSEWRREVFSRDKYTCQCCGKIGGNIVAHHLDGYNWCVEKRTDITNGVTLCEYCHDIEYDGSFHNVYGCGNNTHEQYNEWILNKRKQDAI